MKNVPARYVELAARVAIQSAYMAAVVYDKNVKIDDIKWIKSIVDQAVSPCGFSAVTVTSFCVCLRNITENRDVKFFIDNPLTAVDGE